jgi:hypothetical protein
LIEEEDHINEQSFEHKTKVISMPGGLQLEGEITEVIKLNHRQSRNPSRLPDNINL